MEEGTSFGFVCCPCQCPPSNTWLQILASGYTPTTSLSEPLRAGGSHGAQSWEHPFLREPVSSSIELSF